MLTNWNSTLSRFSNPHILQTTEWGNLKNITGWKPIHYIYPTENDSPQALSLILKRQLHIGRTDIQLCVLYAPKGPILNWEDTDLRIEMMGKLETLAKKERSIFIKIDPDVILGYGQPGTDFESFNPTGGKITKELENRNWISSTEQIQFRNTLYIDLSPDNETILAGMKQKTRYNIRLSERKGIKVRLGNHNDLDLMYQFYAETSIRDGFVIREKNYYIQMWKTFLEADMADILIAEHEGEFAAGLILYRFGTKAWYMYGMSRNFHREKMPSYLLQWEAIQRAKLRGCKIYDMWGAPDEFVDSDPMWGVYRFKEGFGGTVIRTIGAWDFPVKPNLYLFYTKIMPKILQIMRKKGKIQTRKLMNP